MKKEKIALPNIINLTPDETKSLTQRVMESNICAHDKERLIDVFKNYQHAKSALLYQAALEAKRLHALLGEDMNQSDYNLISLAEIDKLLKTLEEDAVEADQDLT
jgi:hypothetical protein